MGPEEQARVVESLPGEVTDEEMAMPERDFHYLGKETTRSVLKGYFGEQRRKAYVAAELPVYYPAERRFAPDLLVVLEAEPHLRQKWVVSHEGKGLDWVMEVHVGGDRKKDAEYNVACYGRLGIPEYFIYDRAREELVAYRLPRIGARQYERIEAREGRFPSRVLGVEFEVVGEGLRLWAGGERLLAPEERLEQVRQRADEEVRRANEEVRRANEEAREEARQRKEAERRLAELQARLDRLL